MRYKHQMTKRFILSFPSLYLSSLIVVVSLWDCYFFIFYVTFTLSTWSDLSLIVFHWKWSRSNRHSCTWHLSLRLATFFLYQNTYSSSFTRHPREDLIVNHFFLFFFFFASPSTLWFTGVKITTVTHSTCVNIGKELPSVIPSGTNICRIN